MAFLLINFVCSGNMKIWQQVRWCCKIWWRGREYLCLKACQLLSTVQPKWVMNVSHQPLIEPLC